MKHILSALWTAVLPQLKAFFNDYDELAGILVLLFAGSHANFVTEFLAVNNWRANDFFLGSIGQGLWLLILYVFGRQNQYSSHFEKVTKGVLSVFLGGMTAMIFLSSFGPLNSSFGVLFGACFQAVWIHGLMPLIDKAIGAKDGSTKDTMLGNSGNLNDN